MAQDETELSELEKLFEAAQAVAGVPMLEWLGTALEDVYAANSQDIKEALRLTRFYVDAMACVQLHCDPVLHRQTLLLNSDLTRLDRESDLAACLNPMAFAFDALELARCVALVADRYEGIRQNTFHGALEDHTRNSARLTPAKRAALELFTQACGVFFEMGRQAKDVAIDPTRLTYLQNLKNHLWDQEVFSQQAADLVRNFTIPTATAGVIMRRSAAGTSGGLLDHFRRFLLEEAPLEVILQAIAHPKEKVHKVVAKPASTPPQDALRQAPTLAKTLNTNVHQEGAYTLVENPYEGSGRGHHDMLIARLTDVPNLLAEQRMQEGDTIRPLTEQEITVLRQQYRAELDALNGERTSTQRKLIQRFARMLTADRTMLSGGTTEDGDILNPAAYARIVANATITDIYHSTTSITAMESTVTIMVDNSTSTKGECNQNVAVCVDNIASALETNGIPTEIIGFTSNRMPKEMKNDDFKYLSEDFKTKLNVNEHILWQHCANMILYKAHSTPWRRARHDLSVCLSESYFGGTPEGFGLYFGWRRILSRPQPKKVIVVIGDGVAEDPLLLSQTLESIKQEGRVYALSITIGASASSADYHQKISIPDSSALPEALTHELINALRNPVPRRSATPKTRSPASTQDRVFV